MKKSEVLRKAAQANLVDIEESLALEGTPVLPDKLSDLLEMALDDMKELKRADPRFQEYMGDWYVNNGTNCTVCLAGAIMWGFVQTAPTFDRSRLTPGSFGADSQGKLEMVNHMRTGVIGRWSLEDFRPGFTEHYDKVNKIFTDVRNSFDSGKGRAPYPVYRQTVRKLREAGL